MIYEEMNKQQLKEEIEKRRTNNVIRIGEIESQLLEIEKLKIREKEIMLSMEQLKGNNIKSNNAISELKMHLRNSIK